MAMTNILAYCDMTAIKAVKCCIVLTPWACFINFFMFASKNDSVLSLPLQ
jgi:hypothetical protein